MTFNSFENYDLLIVGIVMCVLLALIVIMLAKVLCQDKHSEIPIEEKNEDYAVDYPLEVKEFATGISFEELVDKQKNLSIYEKMFLVNAGISSRTGKMRSIRKTHHERIMVITQMLGNNKTTMFSYVDNVLKLHFDTYKDEIRELYLKNKEDIFPSNHKIKTSV